MTCLSIDLAFSTCASYIPYLSTEYRLTVNGPTFQGVQDRSHDQLQDPGCDRSSVTGKCDRGRADNIWRYYEKADSR